MDFYIQIQIHPVTCSQLFTDLSFSDKVNRHNILVNYIELTGSDVKEFAGDAPEGVGDTLGNGSSESPLFMGRNAVLHNVADLGQVAKVLAHGSERLPHLEKSKNSN